MGILSVCKLICSAEARPNTHAPSKARAGSDFENTTTAISVKPRPAEIGGEKVAEIRQRDGAKSLMSDDSWLLIRPSGTEPVLRVYDEGRAQAMVKALLGYGEQVAKSVV